MAETAGRAAAPSVRRGTPRRRGGQLLVSAAGALLLGGVLLIRAIGQLRGGADG